MKKLILVFLAAMTFNANAAFITLTTDKTEYNVGDTISVTVSLTGLVENGTQTFFSSYVTAFNFDSSVLSAVEPSLTSLMAFGPSMAPGIFPSELFAGSVTGNMVSGSSIASPMANPFFQSGMTTVGLYTLQFIATAAGDNIDAFSFTQSDFFDAALGSTQTADVETARFTVSQVPAPSTGILALLGLAALVYSRKQNAK
ncbi:hypothetical protein KUC3_24130 [Alteromonas sp. KC3]|uniref:hypothetical protein n=1 Tax=unclassified Alteromonas TaxID=2614992 RepID=UPI0019229E4B|nr:MULTISPECIES: hypothetical protein [unclassified Alteromonas]BCO19556.1 hypothetical protein KUC3_24130 [Alteromonas sp. KC3]BCO23521.1 hypothetical protein KUC14_23900 [Alteromonas sp. KC14]